MSSMITTTSHTWASPGAFSYYDTALGRWRWNAWANGRGEGGSEPTSEEAATRASEALTRLQGPSDA